MDSERATSLRFQLATEILGARASIEARLSELRRSASEGLSHSLLQRGETQLDDLHSLLLRLEQAPPSELAALTASILASVAASTTLAQQVDAARGAGEQASALHQAASHAHRETAGLAHDLFERRIFDPYLRFASAEDEAEYRRREAERERYIKEQQALGTPQGELNAANAVVEQMEDAKLHGADRSPEFSDRMARIVKAKEDLAAVASPTEARAFARAPEAIPPELTSSKDAAAVLLAAGVSGGEGEQIGHGVTDKPPSRVSGVAGPT